MNRRKGSPQAGRKLHAVQDNSIVLIQKADSAQLCQIGGVPAEPPGKHRIRLGRKLLKQLIEKRNGFRFGTGVPNNSANGQMLPQAELPQDILLKIGGCNGSLTGAGPNI